MNTLMTVYNCYRNLKWRLENEVYFTLVTGTALKTHSTLQNLACVKKLQYQIRSEQSFNLLYLFIMFTVKKTFNI